MQQHVHIFYFSMFFCCKMSFYFYSKLAHQTSIYLCLNLKEAENVSTDHLCRLHGWTLRPSPHPSSVLSFSATNSTYSRSGTSCSSHSVDFSFNMPFIIPHNTRCHSNRVDGFMTRLSLAWECDIVIYGWVEIDNMSWKLCHLFCRGFVCSITDPIFDRRKLE